MSNLANIFLTGLIERGMEPHIAQAFLVNAMDESGLDPAINEIAPLVPGSRGGFGLMQWTGPRRVALEGFAAERGVPVADPNLQMDFLMHELQGPESRAASRIFAAPDKPQAAAAIVNHFLRPAEQHRARREQKYLGGKTPPLSFGADVKPVGLAEMFGAEMPMSMGVPVQEESQPRRSQAGEAVRQRADQTRRLALADLIR